MASFTYDTAATNFQVVYPYLRRDETGIHGSYNVHRTATSQLFHLDGKRREPTVETNGKGDSLRSGFVCSRNLSKFTSAECLRDCRLIARVLPTAEVIGLCEDLGLAPDQIVALQGPFSAALNRELFLRYEAEVIITKNSGTLGGTDTKVQAAAELDLPLIVIDRPPLAYDCLCSTFEEVRDNLHDLLKEDA